MTTTQPPQEGTGHSGEVGVHGGDGEGARGGEVRSGACPESGDPGVGPVGGDEGVASGGEGGEPVRGSRSSRPPGGGRLRAAVRRIPDRGLTAVAAGLAVVAVVSTAAYLPFHAWTANRADIADRSWGDVVLASAWPVIGAFVVRGRPRNPVGWLLMVPASYAPYLNLSLYAVVSAEIADEPLPGADFAAWVGSWGFTQYFVVVPLLLLFFPDGQLPGPRWRFAAYGIVGAAASAALAAMFRDGGIDVSEDVGNPLGIPGASWLGYVTLTGAFATLLPGSAIGVAALVVRTRHAVGVRRTQLQWLVLGGLFLMGCWALSFGSDGRVAVDLLFALGLLGPPVGIAVAMLRHRMFDVVVVLNRTIVYAVLTLAMVGVYAGLVVGAGHIAPTSTAGVVAVAVVALIAAVGRDAMQKAVDRWLFGHRHDPYAVVARVGRHVAPASEPVEALQRLVDALRRALRLPYAAFRGTAGEGEGAAVQAVSGSPVAGWRTVPARALGQDIGELHVGIRPGRERWTPEEQAAVEEVAARAATLAYAAALVADVARSRARIVVAREEERRRLRADLHDGVGPSLAGTAHQLDALARRIEASGQPELADRARLVRDRLRQTVTDLRSVVHGLRPPILDQLGLAGALRDLSAGYETPHCTVELGPGLDELPAAVEVAAYAIAAEAVTNAVRHSAAGELALVAGVDAGTLVVEIRDNGCGMPVYPQAGVGLRSMGERAGEVGGRVDVLPAPGGGTVIRATLPGRTAG
ncbi:histidine kinase [Yinghuangia sp. ASG 101]|uniref:sensor histidine kinase n=1 Tax=Yinghuangia sp. ASG 101 TaxID=2896848 RepID=UPI001E3DE742|nr:histidine kinase [Yinghuangia sp. ASG 101]UGQ14545.1 histidine kinase [Yinghuangia sp. ASG 101]